MKKYTKILSLAISSALLASLTLPIAQPQASAAPTTSYQGYLGDSLSDNTPVLKPKWQTQVDYVHDGGFQAVTTNGVVIYTSKGKFHAADVLTGKVLWSRTNTQSSNIIAFNGAIYYIDQQGSLLKIGSQSGKTMWTAKKVAPAGSDFSPRLFLVNGTLYSTSTLGFSSFDPGTGKRKWMVKPKNTYDFSVEGVYNGIILTSVLENENPESVYTAYDAASGKQLWRLPGGHSEVLEYRDGHVYLLKERARDGKGYAAILDEVSVKTGQVVNSFSYIPVNDIVKEGASQVIIDNGMVYIVQETSDFTSKLTAFKLGVQPEQQTPKVLEGKGKWLIGPYNGTFLYQNGLDLNSHNLNGDWINAYRGPRNPISQLNLIGKAICVGLTDGQFYFLDARTGKAYGKVKTGAREFGTPLIEKGMVLIQAEGRLLAIKQPALLK